MYEINNSLNTFYVYNIYEQTLSPIGGEKEFINFLARAYHIYHYDTHYDCFNTYFDNFACSQAEVYINENITWQFFDSAGRCINPKWYEHEAYAVWLQKYKNFEDNYNYRYRPENKIYKGVFRRTPVEGIHKKTRRHTHNKIKHYAGIQRMWANPEYKGFNRGSRPDSWEMYKFKKSERSWKSQRKHQWRDKKEMITM